MTLIRRAWLLAGLCCAPSHAQASCPITLDGDPEVVEWVRTELAAFAVADDSGCLALRVLCRYRDGGLELELHDELGRSEQRRFASPEGAASFVVSWWRRPLASRLTVVAAASPPAPAPSVTRVVEIERAPPEQAHRRWPEIRLSYVAVRESSAPRWGAFTVALGNREIGFRYGAAVRALVGGPLVTDMDERDYFAVVAGEAEGVVGVGYGRLESLAFRAELAAGGSVIAGASDRVGLEYRGFGVRGGARAVLMWNAGASFGLDAGVAIDALYLLDERELKASDGSMLWVPHLDLGIRWTP